MWAGPRFGVIEEKPRWCPHAWQGVEQHCRASHRAGHWVLLFPEFT